MISEIEIRLRADIARLQTDMNEARRAVGSGLDRINAAVGKTTDLLGGLAIGAAAVSFVQFTKQSIDAADALNDMSIRTKVATEDLVGLSYAAKLSDTSIDAVAKSINKLGMNIGKDAAKFRELGVTATEPVEAFKQLADIFKSIQDPQQRAAFGAEALGKTWQESAILLDMGSKGLTEMMDKGKQLSGVTTQMAADAADFNDKLDTLAFSAQSAGMRFASDLLPMLSLLVDDLTATASATDDATSSFSPLQETIRALVILGGNVSFKFKAVGTEIGAVAAQVTLLGTALIDVLRVDWKSAARNMKQAFAVGDMATADAEKSRAAFDKWEQGWVNVGKAAKTAAKETTEASAADAEAAKQRVAAFLKASEMEAARKKASTEAAAAAKAEAAARKAAQEQYAAWMQTTVEAAERLKKVQDDAYNAALKEAEANELLAATFGMTKSAIEAEELARLEGQLAQKASIGLTIDEIVQLERLIAVKKRNAAAVGTLEALEKQKKATDDAAKEQVKFWESITATAQSTFVSILDGGKDTATRLRDTFKNIFFDWLFQMTLKKWIIGVQGQFSATGGAGGGGVLGEAGNWLDIGQKIYSGFSGGIATSLGTLVAGFGNAIGSSAISAFGAGMGLTTGQAATAAAAYGGTGTAVGGGISAGASAAAALPVVGWIAAGMVAAKTLFAQGWTMEGQTTDVTKTLLESTLKGNVFGPMLAELTLLSTASDKLLQKLGMSAAGANILSGQAPLAALFGHKAPQIESQGLRGNISAAGFSGEAFANILEKGGWFRSDKRSTTTAALGAEQKGAFDETIAAMVLAVKGFAGVVGAEATAIESYNKAINLTLTSDVEANKTAIAGMFAGIADDLSNLIIPNLAALATEGEAASTTLQRLATNYAALDAILGTVGLTFGAVGVGSLEARERLIALSGGLQQLAANVDGFAQNFLTEAERMKPIADAVGTALAGMNLAWVDTREEFKNVVLGIDKTTEAGAKQFAQLLELQAAFAAVHPAIEATTVALEVASEAMQERTRLQTQLDQLGMTAAQIERAAIDDTNKALYDLLTTRKAEIKAAADQATAAQEAANAIAKAQADAAASLAATNRGYEDQITAILKLRMSEAELRAVETKGMDTYTLALYDRVKALQAEDKATQAATDAIKKAAESATATAKAAQDAAEKLAAERMRTLDAARNAVSQAYNREANALQQVIDKSRQAAATLRDYANALKLGATSILSPEQRYAEAQRQFAAASTPEQLRTASDALLDASMAYNSNSEQYAADYRLVQDAIDKAATAADNQVTATESQLVYLQQQVAGIAEVNQSVLSLGAALSQYQAALAAARASTPATSTPPVVPPSTSPSSSSTWKSVDPLTGQGSGGSSKKQASQQEVTTLLAGIQEELAIANQQRIGVAELQTANNAEVTESLGKMTRTLAKVGA